MPDPQTTGADATELPTGRLPLAGRLVAYLFVGLGVHGLLHALLVWWLHDRVGLDLSVFLFAYVGWSLLRGEKNAPGCATALGYYAVVVLSLACLVGIVPWGFSLAGRIDLEGVTERRLRLMVVMAVLLLPPFVWSLRVLKRDEIRRHCDGRRRGGRLRSWRLEHLFVATTIAVLACLSASFESTINTPSQPLWYSGGVQRHNDETWSRYTVIPSMAAPDGQQPIRHLIQVMHVGEEPAFSVEKTPKGLILTVEGERFPLSDDRQLHEYRDGTLTELPCRLTTEEHARFLAGPLAGREKDLSIATLKRFVESLRADGRASADQSGQ